MLKESNDIQIVRYILKNIREEDKQELMALFSSDWYRKTIKRFYGQKFLVLYGYDDRKIIVPIAIGGIDKIYEKPNRVASVWLLSTIWIENNRKLLFSTIKQQLLLAEKDCDVFFNFIYKSNRKLKKWLHKMGFLFDASKSSELCMDDGFEFFYKFIERS